MTIAVAEAELIHQALKMNVDLFVWTTSNMRGVSLDIITHKISVYKEACSVAQKKRKLGEEKRLAAKEKADKLLSIELIQEAKYTTWLGKIVMVTKAKDKWRML